MTRPAPLHRLWNLLRQWFPFSPPERAWARTCPVCGDVAPCTGCRFFKGLLGVTWACECGWRLEET